MKDLTLEEIANNINSSIDDREIQLEKEQEECEKQAKERQIELMDLVKKKFEFLKNVYITKDLKWGWFPWIYVPKELVIKYKFCGNNAVSVSVVLLTSVYTRNVEKADYIVSILFFNKSELDGIYSDDKPIQFIKEIAYKAKNYNCRKGK